MGKILFAVFAVVFLTGVLSISDRKRGVLYSEYGSFDSKVDFYNEEYLNGQSHHVETKGPCQNLPKNWQRRALSVDTHGTCAEVCDEKDCQGVCKPVYPNNGEQKLSDIGMDSKVASVQGCFQNFRQ